VQILPVYREAVSLFHVDMRAQQKYGMAGSIIGDLKNENNNMSNAISLPADSMSVQIQHKYKPYNKFT
jgi:hypothetical protein